MKRYDAIIIGAGHNGLTAAAYLAKAGEWIRYTTPEPTEYVALCLPAFSMETVHRDD